MKTRWRKGLKPRRGHAAEDALGYQLGGDRREEDAVAEVTSGYPDILETRQRTEDWQAIGSSRPQAGPLRNDGGVRQARRKVDSRAAQPLDTLRRVSLLEAHFFHRGADEGLAVLPGQQIGVLAPDNVPERLRWAPKRNHLASDWAHRDVGAELCGKQGRPGPTGEEQDISIMGPAGGDGGSNDIAACEQPRDLRGGFEADTKPASGLRQSKDQTFRVQEVLSRRQEAGGGPGAGFGLFPL